MPGGAGLSSQPGRNPAKPVRRNEMFTLKQNGMIAALAACCMLSLAAPAQAEADSQYRSEFGASIDAGKYDRQIVVSGNTRWVNVNAGEVIRFVVADTAGTSAAFTWRFDPFSRGVADLRQLAPAGMVQRTIKVYIAPDPHYLGS
jgi:hypothetical protein